VNSSESNSEAAKPLVDFDQLNAACDGNTDLMRELIDMYFQQAGEIMAALEKAIAEKSVAQVDHFAHKLAGSSLACGFSPVVPPLRQLEHNAKAGHLEGASDFFRHASVQLENVRCQVRDFLAQAPPS
jgi:HPt (histidine-containing phosphotransfer) domain-containing protein